MDTNRFRRFSTLVLGYTVFVIVWGAFVRASKSGAGCGNHWPLCNGQVVPLAPSLKTVIEFTHRLTSGLAGIFVVVQLVAAVRLRKVVPRALMATIAATFFMGVEALVGRGLVRFDMVAENRSPDRAYWMGGHLVNTFALLAALTLIVFFSRERAATTDGRPRGGSLLALGAGLAGTIVVAVTGAIAALGDTLFPAASLSEGFRQDLAPASHVFLRLRIWHPFLAVALALLLLITAAVVRSRPGRENTAAAATALAALVLAQVSVGVLNLVLLAPVTLQLVHLLLADLVWIALVWLFAGTATRA